MGHGDKPPMHIVDKNIDGTHIVRPLAYRDVVILLRATKFKSDQYAEILRRHDIPVHRDSGSGFFNTTEVRDMLALLKLIDNAQQDIPLAAVLRSPLLHLPDTESAFARIRIAYAGRDPFVPFHQAVTRYAAEQNDDLAAQLRTLLDTLTRWRTLSRLRPPAELIWRIFEETDYLTYCSGLENGEQRCANLRYFHERAKQFGTFDRQGLYRFVRFLEGLQAKRDIGMPSVLGAGEDVVRIMSVHHSKGLEFPVVFLPDLGKKINLASSSGRVLADRERHLGMAAVDESKQVRYPSLAYVLVQERLRQQLLAEELRVLYVATTRAKEHLILVGTCESGRCEKWTASHGTRIGPLPADMVLAANTMLDWIGSAAAAMRGGGDNGIETITHDAAEISAWIASPTGKRGLSPAQQSLAGLNPLTPPPSADPVADAVIERLEYQYAFAPFANLRAAIAVTEWAKRSREDASLTIPQTPLAPFAALSKSTSLNAADRGTATHLVLEHLDYSRPCRGEDLTQQIDRMVHTKLISPEQAAAVNRETIEWFVDGEIGQMIRNAAKGDVIRELAFNLALPPDELSQTPNSSDPRDQIMLRGRIDLLIRQGDSFIVIDYKTDNISEDQIKARAAYYEPQVQIYRQAILEITRIPVSAVYLIFLSPRLAIQM